MDIKELLNIKSLVAFIFGVIIGTLTMYYGFIEKIDVMEVEIHNINKEVDNIHDVLHLHYKKLLELK